MPFYWSRFWPWLGKLFGLKAGPPAASDDKSVEWKSFDLYLDSNIAYKHRAKWYEPTSALCAAEEPQLVHFLADRVEPVARSAESVA
jgi:hypothetical protein